MLRATLLIALQCPWASYIAKRHGAHAKLMQCIPVRDKRGGGTLALALLRMHGADPKELATEVKLLPHIRWAEFEKAGRDLIMGMVRTSLCPCSMTLLPHFNLVDARQNGPWLEWTMIVRNSRQLRKLTAHLERIGISYKIKGLKPLKNDTSLTAKQEMMLRAALELGFYDVPRRTSLKELARLFGTSPRAASEVLRRAHRKLVALGLMNALNGGPA